MLDAFEQLDLGLQVLEQLGRQLVARHGLDGDRGRRGGLPAPVSNRAGSKGSLYQFVALVDGGKATPANLFSNLKLADPLRATNQLQGAIGSDIAAPRLRPRQSRSPGAVGWTWPQPDASFCRQRLNGPSTSGSFADRSAFGRPPHAAVSSANLPKWPTGVNARTHRMQGALQTGALMAFNPTGSPLTREPPGARQTNRLLASS